MNNFCHFHYNFWECLEQLATRHCREVDFDCSFATLPDKGRAMKIQFLTSIDRLSCTLKKYG
jgi:hypothetical protein